MSTETQLRGDSLRRQLEASASYAREHNLNLVEDLRDIGVSGFTGANVREGALGRFRDAVRSRRFPSGSFLLIENLDRFSRQAVMKSLGLLIELVNSGITIVTTSDGRRYTAQTGIDGLMFMIFDMERAHGESKRKSSMVRAAWKTKRRNAHEKKLTATAPGWLRLSSDRKEFLPIPERVKVLQRIFEESAAGIGSASIAKRLNQAGVPSFGRGGTAGFSAHYINKILKGRSVLGAFQPMQDVDGKRVPDGEVIEMYYPQVVSNDLYYRSAEALSRRGRGRDAGGRKGQRVTNLFVSPILRCAYCNGRVHFVSRGNRPTAKSFLLCDRARRRMGCEATKWVYSDLEASFLSFCSEVDLDQVVRGEDADMRRSVQEDIVLALRGEKSALENQIENMLKLVDEAGTELKFVAARMKKLEARHVEVEQELREAERRQEALRSIDTPRENIAAIVRELQGRKDDEEVYRIRSRLALKIRSLVTMILVAPAGHAPFIRKAIADEPDVPASVVDHEAYHRRYFGVGFRDGTVRAVIPDRDDPMKFEVQIVGAKGGTAGAVIDPDQEDPLRFDLS